MTTEITTTTTSASSFLPVQKNIVTPKGKVTGVRLFAGGIPAGELRKALRAQGHTGKRLDEKVREALECPEANRKAQAVLFIECLHQDGYAFDVADRRDKSAAMKFVKVADKEAVALAAKDEEIAKLKAAADAQAAELAVLRELLEKQLA